MKKIHLAIALTLTLCLGLVVGAIGATAAGTTATVSATLDYGATVELNGVPQDFLDANGDRIYLLNYNDSMYLPVRKTAELVGLDVDWDGATHTVKLGNTKDVDLVDNIGAYYLDNDRTKGIDRFKVTQTKTSDGKTTTISGVECNHWLQFWLNRNSYNNLIPVGTKARASFNLGGKYESVTFKCYSPQDAVLRVYADGESLQKEIDIRGGAVAQELTVSLFGTAELTLEVEKKVDGASNGISTNVYVFDATVKPIQK